MRACREEQGEFGAAAGRTSARAATTARQKLEEVSPTGMTSADEGGA